MKPGGSPDAYKCNLNGTSGSSDDLLEASRFGRPFGSKSVSRTYAGAGGIDFFSFKAKLGGFGVAFWRPLDFEGCDVTKKEEGNMKGER